MSSPTFMCLPAPYQSLPIDSNGNSPPPGFQTSVLAQQGRKTPQKQTMHLPLTHQEWRQRRDETPERGFFNKGNSYSSVILTESNLIPEHGKVSVAVNRRMDDSENQYQTPERLHGPTKSTPSTYPVMSEKIMSSENGRLDTRPMRYPNEHQSQPNPPTTQAHQIQPNPQTTYAHHDYFRSNQPQSPPQPIENHKRIEGLQTLPNSSKQQPKFIPEIPSAANNTKHAEPIHTDIHALQNSSSNHVRHSSQTAGWPPQDSSKAVSPPGKYDAPQFGLKNPFNSKNPRSSLPSDIHQYNYQADRKKETADPKKETVDPNPLKKKQQQLPVQLQLHDQQSVVDLENEEVFSKRMPHEKDEVLKSLVKQLQEKSRQLQEKEDQLRHCKQENESLQLRSTGQKPDEQNRLLRKQLTDKEKDFEDILEKLNGLQDLYQREIQGMHRRNQEESSRQSGRIEEMAATQQELQEQVELLQQQLQHRDDEIHQLEHDRQHLHHQNRETSRQNDHLRDQLHQMIQQLRDIEGTDRALEESISNLAVDNQNLQVDLKSIQEHNKTLQEENQLLEMELERTRMLIDVQQQDMEAVQAQNQLLKNQLQELQTQPSKRSTDLERQLNDLSDRLETLFRRSHQDPEDAERHKHMEHALQRDLNQMATLVSKKREQMQSFKNLCQDIVDSNQ